MSLFDLNAWDDEWFVAIKALQKEKKVGKKGKRKRSDLICELYTNAYKLGANWDGQDFKTMQINHNNFFCFTIIEFPIFYVVETCSKIDFWFQFLL